MIKTRLLKMLSKETKYVWMEILWQWISLIAQIVIAYCAAGIISQVYGAVTFGVVGSFGILPGPGSGQARSLSGNGAVGTAGQALSGAIDLQWIIPYIAVAAVCIIIRVVCDLLYTDAGFKASVNVKKVMRTKIYEKLLRLGSSYRESVPSSQITQMMGEGVEQLEIYFGKYISQFIYALLAPVTLFLVLMNVNMKVALVLLVAVPFIPMVIMVVMKVARKILDKYFQIYYGLGDTFLEKLQGMTTLKIYQADEQAAKEMDEESEHFRKITMKVLSMQLNSTSIMDIVAYGGTALGLLISILELRKGNLDLFGAVLFIMLSAEFFLPMRLLGSFFHIGMNGMKAADKMFDFLDLPEGEEKELLVPDAASGRVDIEIRDLSFSYGDRQVLDSVDMRAVAGKLVSIVGVSGSGKSTIAGILRGQNKGYKGSVKVNGAELSEVKEAALLSCITTVSHNSYIFSGTVRENLLMGVWGREAGEGLFGESDTGGKDVDTGVKDIGAGGKTAGVGAKDFDAGGKSAGASGAEREKSVDDRLWDALEMVNLKAFLESEQGLDTVLKEGGSNFSGGQRQRLAFARALLKDSPVYILDESTSNIDVESEEIILKLVHRLVKERKKTVILISHRLANVVDSDMIYMLEDGKVTKKGTHGELLKIGGAYADLYNEQRGLENYAK